MGEWLFWLIVAALLGVGELLTLTFVLAMLAVGAAAAAVAAGLGAGGAIEVVVFAVVSIAGVAVVVPTARRHRHGPALRTGTDALIGRRGRTTTVVSMRDGGRVLIGGEEWSAAPYDDSLVIPTDAWVDVLAISGATAVIHPLELPLAGTELESR